MLATRLAALSLAVASNTLSSQSVPSPLQQAKLVAPFAVAGDETGRSVAISGDTAVMGAQYYDLTSFASHGSAFVYTKSNSTWSMQAELTSATGLAFGIAVAIDGETLAVGSHESHGTAYVFVRSGSSWIQEAKLLASGGPVGYMREGGIALAGDTLVMGTPEDGNGGSAYVFVRNGTTWTQQARLTPTNAAPDMSFGFSVAASGNTIAVGAVGDGQPGSTNEGSVYVFTRTGTTWLEQAKLVADDHSAGASMGFSLSCSGDTVLAGAPFPGGSTATGAAYVFVRKADTWTQQAKLTPIPNQADDQFGISVAIDGDVALIGDMAFNVHNQLADAGAMYVFSRSGNDWTQQPKATAEDADIGDGLGYHVALSGTVAIGGSPFKDVAGQVSAGGAYVFLLQPTKLTGLVVDTTTTTPVSGASIVIDGLPLDTTSSDGMYMIDGAPTGLVTISAVASGFHTATQTVEVVAGQTTYADFGLTPTFTNLGQALAGSAGSPSMSASGSLEAGSSLSLQLTSARSFALAPLVVGIASITLPFKGGVLVPSPDFVFPLFTDFFGLGTFGGLWPPGVPSGFTTYFQWWIQDPAGPKGFAASNALAGTTP